MSESVSLCRGTSSLQALRVNEYIAVFYVCVFHVHSIKTKPSKTLSVQNTHNNAPYRRDYSLENCCYTIQRWRISKSKIFRTLYNISDSFLTWNFTLESHEQISFILYRAYTCFLLSFKLISSKVVSLISKINVCLVAPSLAANPYTLCILSI
jgi:hypothetical protein